VSHGSAGRTHLQLDALGVQLDSLDLEVDADGGNESGGKRIICISKQQASFANAWRREGTGRCQDASVKAGPHPHYLK
jgi:hypothetical protein